MGKHTTLPKNAKIGTIVERTISVRGSRRKMRWKRVRNFGKNKNLKWKVISNKKPK